MLSKRGLYPTMGGQLKQKAINEDHRHDWEKTLPAINWLMYLCNGKNSILDIVEKTNLNFDLLSDTAFLLEQHKLLERT